MVAEDITTALAGTANKVQILSPKAQQDLEFVLPRWSYTGVSPPHSIVIPSSAEDIKAVIEYATKHKLKIIPVTGGHSPFTPITPDTIYLSMQKFGDISLNEAKGEVVFGGGVLTGEILKELGDRGWYTCVPNSNSVGMVGALMGAMQHATIGMHGLGSQNMKEVTIIPFSMPGGSAPQELKVSRNSGDVEERRLFNVLCEAGFGCGVITSIKLAAWKISDLNATSRLPLAPHNCKGADHRIDNQVWTRSMIFPPNAIGAAARACLSVCPPPPPLKPTLVVMRAPPMAPRSGAPMILLAFSYFGPKEEAGAFLDKTIPKDALEQAVNITTGATSVAKMNDPYAVMSRHGGFKEFEGGFLQDVDEEGLTRALEIFLKFTDANMASRAGSNFLISCWNPEQVQEIAKSSPGAFVPSRDRGFFTQAVPWYTAPEERGEALTFAKGVYEALMAKDARNGLPKVGFVNNVHIGSDMREVFGDEQTKEISKVKALFDKSRIGWNPVADGWSRLIDDAAAALSPQETAARLARALESRQG